MKGSTKLLTHNSETCVRASGESYFVWTGSWSLNLSVHPQSTEDNPCHSMLSWLCYFPSAVTPWLMQMGIFHPGWYWCLLCRCLGLIALAGMGGISSGNYRLNAVKFLWCARLQNSIGFSFLFFFFFSFSMPFSYCSLLSFFIYLLTI